MKSATGLTGSGVRDWVVQRVSAYVLAFYTLIMLGWFMLNGGFEYTDWYGFMSTLPMKILSILAVLSLVGHAWVGMWTIFTDYIKSSGLRLIVQSLMIIAVFVYLFWAIRIFW